MEFKGVVSVLNKYGRRITDTIQNKLKSDRTFATGKTYNSVDYEVNGTTLEISMDSTVEGVSKGINKRTHSPSRTSIIRWMKAKNIQPRVNNRFVARTDSNYKKSAFLIGRAIYNNGTIKRFSYRGSKVLTVAFGAKIRNRLTDELSKAFIAEASDELLNTLLRNGFTNK